MTCNLPIINRNIWGRSPKPISSLLSGTWSENKIITVLENDGHHVVNGSLAHWHICISVLCSITTLMLKLNTHQSGFNDLSKSISFIIPYMTIYTYCRHSWFQICDFSHLSKTLQSDLMSWFPLHKYPDPCFLQINQFSVYLIFKYTSSVEKNRIYVKTNSCEWCNFRLSFCTVWIKAKKHNHMSDNIVKVKALKWHSLKCEFFL